MIRLEIIEGTNSPTSTIMTTARKLWKKRKKGIKLFSPIGQDEYVALQEVTLRETSREEVERRWEAICKKLKRQGA